jgi:hypothetical protein
MTSGIQQLGLDRPGSVCVWIQIRSIPKPLVIRALLIAKDPPAAELG